MELENKIGLKKIIAEAYKYHNDRLAIFKTGRWDVIEEKYYNLGCCPLYNVKCKKWEGGVGEEQIDRIIADLEKSANEFYEEREYMPHRK